MGDPPPHEPLAPPPCCRAGRNLVAVGTVVAAAILVLVGVGAYALVGNRVASDRIASADGAIGGAREHHNDFVQSMAGVGQGFGALSDATSTSTNVKTLAEQLLQRSQQQVRTVADDRSRLDGAAKRLQDSGWLTLLSRRSLDRELTRIHHADTALDAAMTMSSDYVQDGEFLQAYGASLADLDDLVAQTQAKDVVGANTALSRLEGDVGNALGLSGAPGLPAQVRDFMVDFQKLATDFVAVFNAAAAGDSSALAAAQARGNADLDALKAVDMSQVGADMTSYYQPYETTFRQEMDQASS